MKRWKLKLPKWNFLQAVFHKFYLVHCWTPWPIYLTFYKTIMLFLIFRRMINGKKNGWIFRITCQTLSGWQIIIQINSFPIFVIVSDKVGILLLFIFCCPLQRFYAVWLSEFKPKHWWSFLSCRKILSKDLVINEFCSLSQNLSS